MVPYISGMRDEYTHLIDLRYLQGATSRLELLFSFSCSSKRGVSSRRYVRRVRFGTETGFEEGVDETKDGKRWTVERLVSMEASEVFYYQAEWHSISFS